MLPRRKTLLPVKLTYLTPTSKPICPSCSRELTNATPAVLLSSRSPLLPDEEAVERKKKKVKKNKDEPFVCGHVICWTCSDTIVQPTGRCCVCEAKIEDGDMIPLGKEG